MEELEKRRMVKRGKIMMAFTAPHIRALVDRANELGIKKEDIVDILNKDGEVILVYYG